jgi:hypothetical protein
MRTRDIAISPPPHRRRYAYQNFKLRPSAKIKSGFSVQKQAFTFGSSLWRATQDLTDGWQVGGLARTLPEYALLFITP